MHIHNLPKFRDHWDENPLLRTPVKDLFPIWRFVNVISKFYYYPGCDVTIDERMISFRGRSDFRSMNLQNRLNGILDHMYYVTL